MDEIQFSTTVPSAPQFPKCRDATGNYAFIKPLISDCTENLIHITQYVFLSYASEERMV